MVICSVGMVLPRQRSIDTAWGVLVRLVACRTNIITISITLQLCLNPPFLTGWNWKVVPKNKLVKCGFSFPRREMSLVAVYGKRSDSIPDPSSVFERRISRKEIFFRILFIAQKGSAPLSRRAVKSSWSSETNMQHQGNVYHWCLCRFRFRNRNLKGFLRFALRNWGGLTD